MDGLAALTALHILQVSHMASTVREDIQVAVGIFFALAATSNL